MVDEIASEGISMSWVESSCAIDAVAGEMLVKMVEPQAHASNKLQLVTYGLKIAMQISSPK